MRVREKHGMMQRLRISQVDISDYLFFEKAELLEKECFSCPRSKKQLIEELSNGVSIYFKAEIENELAGYIGAYMAADEAFVYDIAVFEKYRRKGIGGTLLTELLDYYKKYKAKTISLEVRVSNYAAIGLYESFGFKRICKRPHFYENPVEDAYIYTVDISQYEQKNSLIP